MATHIEREQKFLVDADEFSKLNLTNYKQIRQCYLSVEQGGALEVRLRHTCPVGTYANCASTYTQTIKRCRQDDAVARDEVEWPVEVSDFEAAWALSPWRLEKRRYEGGVLRIAAHPEQLRTLDRIGRWGTCGGCPRVEGVVYPERCDETARYDHQITSVTSWQVDVFTSGALKGVAVAELEIEQQYSDVAQFLQATKQTWPAWLARFGSDVVDLTHRRVNLVAAGGVAPDRGLLQALDDLATSQRLRRVQSTYAEQLRQREPYTSAPRNRQGVVDLDAAAVKARQRGKTASFSLLEAQRVVKRKVSS